MKEAGGPVRDFERIQRVLRELNQKSELPTVDDLDFDDTEKTFSHRTDAELKKSARLFTLMNKPWLTNILSGVGLKTVQWGIPGAAWLMRKTIYTQFVGGTSLVSTEPTISKLFERGVYSMLDYGAEGKEREKDFNRTMNEVLRGIEFAARSEAVKVVTTKISGMARNGLLEDLQKEEFVFSPELRTEYKSVMKRLDAICAQAKKLDVQIYFDAEESWMQDTLDQMVTILMRRYNTEKAIVFNTFQLYRHDRLEYLINSHTRARAANYKLGAKLVRGAYMDKERARALEMGYPSPIHRTMDATHDDFNAAVRYCVENCDDLSSCNASHNRESVLLQAALMKEHGVAKNHPNLFFCQLYGMSDNLTFNLAEAGYNVAKYVVYGPVKEVAPYLIRRARENTSVTGDVSRELDMIQRELKRRGI